MPKPVSAEDLVIALAAVRERVEEVGEDDDLDEHLHFYPKVLGGAWTAAHLYVPYDRISAMSRSHTAVFRRLFHIPQMRSFTLATYGGEHNCHMLVRGWVRKITYYYVLWCDKGSVGEDFSDEEHDSFAEPYDWLDWALALPGDEAAFARVMEFRAWRPKL